MKKPKHLFEIIVITLIIMCVFIIGYTSNRNSITSIESRVTGILNKIQGFFYGIGDGIRSSIDTIINFSNIKKEKEDLQKQVYELKKELAERETDKKKIDELREELDFQKKYPQYTFEGSTIIRPGGINGSIEFFIIDKGSNQGIKNDMVVVNYDGLIGKVVVAAENWSKVQLLTNENIRISASVESKENERGMIEGHRDAMNNVMCKFITPIDMDIKVGDVVVTSGVGNIYPKGIKIGEIIKIEDDKVKLQKTADIKPFIDIGKIEEVYIIIPSDRFNVEY